MGVWGVGGGGGGGVEFVAVLSSAWNNHQSEPRSCVEVEGGPVLGSPSLTVFMVSVDVKQHCDSNSKFNQNDSCIN